MKEISDLKLIAITLNNIERRFYVFEGISEMKRKNWENNKLLNDIKVAINMVLSI